MKEVERLKRKLIDRILRVWMVRMAMRRPITIMVLCVAIAIGAVSALFDMQFDIFPNLGTPQIYVVEPYGGMDPKQMESFIAYNFEKQFSYVNGIQHIESKSIGETTLLKLQFYPDTNMSSAMGEVVARSTRALKNMPPGTLPPLILRFDSGNLPVGDLVFSSDTRSLGEIEDYALNYVRPLVATLPGLLVSDSFGSSPRAIVIRVNPKKLRSFNLSPQDVVNALAKTNQIEPSGHLKIGNFYPAVPINSIVSNIDELLKVPIHVGTYPTVFLGDIATVRDATDIPVGYALLNGHRTIYLPVIKRSDSSTLTVVREVKDHMTLFQNVLPDDIKVSYQFDQSGVVKDSIKSLSFEGIVGALLTGLMVLLFLRDWKSALIVIINIPLAIMGAIVSLKVAHQTINIMTLGGLALAIGILVDESTITIENIHVRLEKGESLAAAALNGASEIFSPALLTMLCILSVFIPAFFMGGMAKALFVPLTLAVGFSIIWAFFLSMTLVPILATWLLKKEKHHAKKGGTFLDRMKGVHLRILTLVYNRHRLFLSLYAVLAVSLVTFLGTHIGREIFPRVESHELQLRIKAPAGTYIDQTEQILLKVIDLIKQTAGPDSVSATLAYVGTQPTQYAINTIFLWTAGPQEAVLQVAFKKDSSVSTADLKEKLRAVFKKELPDVDVSFEVSGMVDKVMSSGAPTEIDIDVNGQDLDQDRQVAAQIKQALAALPAARDVQYGQPLEYPTLDVNVDRKQAGLRGVHITDVGKALVPVTSSSRFTLPNYWEDPKDGVNYQVQVEVPSKDIKTIEDLKRVPIPVNEGAIPLEVFAQVKEGTEVAEYDRYNLARMASVTGNLFGLDLGHSIGAIDRILETVRKTMPKSVQINVRGQIEVLQQMTNGLIAGLVFAVVVMLLLLSGTFESVPIALIVISNVPAVLSGSLAALYLTGSTLNIESFMGTIMAVGVSVSNSILLVTFADLTRRSGKHSWEAAIYGAQSRLRPVLMTAIAMVVGMIPMASGLSDSGQQTAPLARAVIGGLTGSTITTLLIMPVIYAIAHKNKPTYTASLDPQDPHSANFEEKES